MLALSTEPGELFAQTLSKLWLALVLVMVLGLILGLLRFSGLLK